jgi:cell division protein FtsB
MAREDLQSRFRHVWGPLLALALMAYFIYHIIQGERGLLSWMRLKQKIAESEKVLAEVQSKKEALEKRVSLLRPESIDPDMLEERARAVLNFARKDEIVVIDDSLKNEGTAIN